MKEAFKNDNLRYYSVRAVDNYCAFGRDMVIKGTAVSTRENGGYKFVKTLYEVKPAYCVSREK